MSFSKLLENEKIYILNTFHGKIPLKLFESCFSPNFCPCSKRVNGGNICIASCGKIIYAFKGGAPSPLYYVSCRYKGVRLVLEKLVKIFPKQTNNFHTIACWRQTFSLGNLFNQIEYVTRIA